MVEIDQSLTELVLQSVYTPRNNSSLTFES